MAKMRQVQTSCPHNLVSKHNTIGHRQIIGCRFDTAKSAACIDALRQRTECIKHFMPHALCTLVPLPKNRVKVLHALHACVQMVHV